MNKKRLLEEIMNTKLNSLDLLLKNHEIGPLLKKYSIGKHWNEYFMLASLLESGKYVVQAFNILDKRYHDNPKLREYFGKVFSQ